MIESVKFSFLKPIVACLGVLRIRRIYKDVLGRNEQIEAEDILSPGDALLMIVAAILKGRQIVREDQLDLIIDELGKSISNFGKMVSEANNKDRTPVAHLVIVDRMFVRMSGEQEFLDIRSGKKTNKLDLPPIEILTFDLTAALLRTLSAIKKETQ